MSEANKIKIEYEDGDIKELKKGIAVEFNNKKMSVDMVNVSNVDLIRLVYGMLKMVDEMGMTSLLQTYANGGPLPDEV
jgi:hypothetical protein